MSGIEILTNGMAFELRDEDDVDGAKGFSWCTHFSGTYRVQLAFDELAVPPDAFIREQYAVHFPTGRLVRMQDGGEVQSAVVATVPPGHYHATLHCSWREESKHIGLTTGEYPEGDGPDGIIVLRPLRRRVWMGDVVEFFTSDLSFAISDEADADQSLGYTWTPVVSGTYFMHLGLEDGVTPTAEIEALDRRNVRFKTGRLMQSSREVIGTIPSGHYEAILYGSEGPPSKDPERTVADAVIVLRPRVPME